MDRDPVQFAMVAQYMRQNDPFALFKTDGRLFEREMHYYGITLRVVLCYSEDIFRHSHIKDESHSLWQSLFPWL